MTHEADLAQTRLLGLGSRASYRLLIAGNETESITQTEASIQAFTNGAK
jgi:predicted lysophospholipase L1 biosynthesis ABC-type transport system permease subunit